jgi:hypothetical protein
MIGLRATRTTFLAAALLCTPAHAAGDSTVREMMVESGMIEQFGNIGDESRTAILQMAERRQGMPRQLAEGLAGIAARVLDGERFVADLEVRLVETLSSEEAEAITAFYISDFGQRVRDAEVSASTTSARRRIESIRSELRAEIEKDPQRLALFREIDAALFASELSATTAVSIGQAMAVGMAEGQPGGADPGALAALKDRMALAHDQIVAEMRDRLLTTFAFTYRGLSDSELEDYADFLETEAAKATNAALFEAVHTILSERGEEIGEAFGALVRQKRT